MMEFMNAKVKLKYDIIKNIEKNKKVISDKIEK